MKEVFGWSMVLLIMVAIGVVITPIAWAVNEAVWWVILRLAGVA